MDFDTCRIAHIYHRSVLQIRFEALESLCALPIHPLDFLFSNSVIRIFYLKTFLIEIFNGSFNTVKLFSWLIFF